MKMTSNPISKQKNSSSSAGSNTNDVELGSIKGSQKSNKDGLEGESQKSSSSKVPHIHVVVSAIKPESKIKLEGKWAWGFFIWYVVVSCVMIGSLCWFFLVGSCVVNSTVVDTTIGELTHQGHSKKPVFATAYNSNMNLGTYICSSYVYGNATGIIPCYLPGLDCHDYTHSKAITDICEPLVSFSCGATDDGDDDYAISYTCGDVITSSTAGAVYATVTYLQCTNLPTTIVNAVQYTLYAFMGIYLLYMVFWTVCNLGPAALLSRDTWLSFFNLQVTKEE